MGRLASMFGTGIAATLLMGAGTAFAQSVTLTSIGIQDTGDSQVVEIAASGQPTCTDFFQPDPARITVQCVDVGKGAIEPMMRVGTGLVERIETSEVADSEATRSQVVIYLTEPKEYSSEMRGTAWVVTVGTAAASGADDPIAAALQSEPTASSAEAGNFALETTRTGKLSSVDGDHNYATGAVQVRGVDFQQRLDAGVSRLVITGDQRLDYTTSYPRDDRMVISLRDAALGTGLERRIDTSKFASAVDEVAAFRSRQAKGEVRVVVDLREPVTPTISEQGSVLVVDFPIPPSIAGAAYEAPDTVVTYEEEPDGDALAADDRIESAIGRETYITESGETRDPVKQATRRADCMFGNEDCVFLGEIDADHNWKGFPLNLNLVNADIHNVFRLIAAVAKINIVTSDSVKGTVSVQLAEVPWDQALAAILQAKGLGAVQYGAVLRVAPLSVIRLEREDAAAARIAQDQARKLHVLTLPLNYAESMEVIPQIQALLTSRGSATNDIRTNSIIVRDVHEVLGQVRQLVRTLDTRTPQVHIEARIVEASDGFSRSLGIQWGGNLNFSPQTGYSTGLFFPNSVGVSGGSTATIVNSVSSTQGGRSTAFTNLPNYVVDLPSASQNGSLGINLGSLSSVINLDMRIAAGENDGTSKIISAPSITTVTNTPATIRDGARIPYETASLRGTNVQFVEAVLLLEVTPSITADGTIFLQINVNKNRPDFGAAVRGLPTIEIKEAQTTVMVSDGDTAVIGGVYNYEESFSRNFVPGLGKIPVLGWLFKNSTKREDRSEMLVFITPQIVRAVD